MPVMVGNLDDTYEQLASTDMWEDVMYVFVGFFAPVLFGRFIEGVGSGANFNIYDELYGVAVIVVAEMALDDMDDARRNVQLGGGLFAIDQLAERYDVKQKIQNLI